MSVIYSVIIFADAIRLIVSNFIEDIYVKVKISFRTKQLWQIYVYLHPTLTLHQNVHHKSKH